jgi:hypothetical protein
MVQINVACTLLASRHIHNSIALSNVEQVGIILAVYRWHILLVGSLYSEVNSLLTPTVLNIIEVTEDSIQGWEHPMYCTSSHLKECYNYMRSADLFHDQRSKLYRCWDSIPQPPICIIGLFAVLAISNIPACLAFFLLTWTQGSGAIKCHIHYLGTQT